MWPFTRTRKPTATPRSLVYFAYIGDDATPDGPVPRRIAFMESQLQWIAALIQASGLHYEVVVPYVAPRKWDAAVHDIIQRYGFRIDPASVAASRINRFEYLGFRALKEIAEAAADPDHLIYYCHSKGITQLSPSKMGLFRLHTHIGLTADLRQLAAEPRLTRATLFPSKFGWCFYNFFWIKARYMAGLTVDESADRYAFESLVGDPTDREGYRGVLPLIGLLPQSERGLPASDWYRASDTSSPELTATYDRYATLPPL
jgi:hypothetical protein